MRSWRARPADVLKQVRGSDLAVAVRTAASGQSLLHPGAASKLIARRRDASGKHDLLARLTPRERSVLELIGEGLTNRQIGERLFIAEKTVKNHVSTLFRKLGLKQRTAAAAYVARIHNSRLPVEQGQTWPPPASSSSRKPGPSASGAEQAGL